MNKVGPFTTTVAAAALFATCPAKAAQQLHAETTEGWYVYKEDKSCVAYIDFPSGTTLRFSNRIDEHRMYFSAYNENWEHLRPLKGQTVTLTLEFVDLKRVHGTAAVINESPNGRMGLSGADLGNDEIMLALAGSPRMKIGVLYGGSVKQVVVESVTLSGGQKGVLNLSECSSKYF